MDKDTLFSSFGKWVSTINFQQFEEHVEVLDQDKCTKKLTAKAYLWCFCMLIYMRKKV